MSALWLDDWSEGDDNVPDVPAAVWPPADRDARRANADVVARLRALADTIESLDLEEPLTRLTVAPGVQVSAWGDDGPIDEAARVRSVDRLNAALGVPSDETDYGHYAGVVEQYGAWYAYTPLTAAQDAARVSA